MPFKPTESSYQTFHNKSMLMGKIYHKALIFLSKTSQSHYSSAYETTQNRFLRFRKSFLDFIKSILYFISNNSLIQKKLTLKLLVSNQLHFRRIAQQVPKYRQSISPSFFCLRLLVLAIARRLMDD